MYIFISSTLSKPEYLEIIPIYGKYMAHLVTPRNRLSVYAIKMYEQYGIPWACDNHAFSGFDEKLYETMLTHVTGKNGCLWVCLPDVVGDCEKTLELFYKWKDKVIETGHPLAFVAQDGCTASQIPWDSIACIFIGGTTEFKLSRQVQELIIHAKSRNKIVHMGRVNTKKRYRYANHIGCDSVDGTNVCRWKDVYLIPTIKYLAELDSSFLPRGQLPLF